MFNGKDGEFAGTIIELKKKGGLVSLGAQNRAQIAEPDLTLLFAPVKRGAVEAIIQKAVEVGVARFVPVLTERTVNARMNIDRLQAIATEAAEQCERLSVPEVDAPQKLSNIVADWPAGRRLMFCDEAGDDETQPWGGPTGRALPVLEALKGSDSSTDQWAILTGPEGGFSPAERQSLREKSFVTSVTLGPRVLRADTAAIAALVLWQAAIGDWQEASIT